MLRMRTALDQMLPECRPGILRKESARPRRQFANDVRPIPAASRRDRMPPVRVSSLRIFDQWPSAYPATVPGRPFIRALLQPALFRESWGATSEQSRCLPACAAPPGDPSLVPQDPSSCDSDRGRPGYRYRLKGNWRYGHATRRFGHWLRRTWPRVAISLSSL